MADRQGTSVDAEQESYIKKQIREEEITETKQEAPRCERCLREGPSMRERPSVREHVAVFLCFVCEMYVCVNCLSGHQSHEGMKVGRKESDREMEREKSETDEMEEQSSSEGIKNKGKGLGKKAQRMRLEEKNEREEQEREIREGERMDEENERKLSVLLNDLMNEDKAERIEKFENGHVSIYDRVNVKHGLDQGYCGISGLCVLENQRWVACDNCCIKIFTLGSNVLQRYIRFVGFGSKPWDVTEIRVNQNSTEPNLVSGSSSEVSVTDRADPDKQCLIAVTLPWRSQIMFIDLSKKPAKTQKIIRTEGRYWSIQFYDDKIFTVCEDLNFRCSIYIKSTDGVTINKFETDIYSYLLGPYLTVVSGRVYIADGHNHKVQCRNVEGQVISEITTEGSRPVGISVDPDNNVYVCAQGHNKVYKLDPDLTRYKSVLDQTADHIEGPYALCYYRDKLFISHFGTTSLRDYVTVVRLL